ncbi:hypothetical protein J6590_097099 [Homalodisca vitripennis]|nr:hypothetical protein J6590_097099 [Homalodisca vitripennis]
MIKKGKSSSRTEYEEEERESEEEVEDDCGEDAEEVFVENERQDRELEETMEDEESSSRTEYEEEEGKSEESVEDDCGEDVEEVFVEHERQERELEELEVLRVRHKNAGRSSVERKRGGLEGLEKEWCDIKKHQSHLASMKRMDNKQHRGTNSHLMGNYTHSKSLKEDEGAIRLATKQVTLSERCTHARLLVKNDREEKTY